MGIRHVVLLSTALAHMASAAPAAPGIVQGRLEMQWGDSTVGQPGSRGSGRFRVNLVTDQGVRHALDPAQARRAAGDLHALSDRRVAVEFSRTVRTPGPPTITSLVPADRLALPAGDGSLYAPSALTGNTRWITIACKFNDIAAEQKPVSFFRSQYGAGPGLLDHYWREVSYGKINLAGSDAHGWFTLPKPRAQYIDSNTGNQSANLGLLFEDCVAAAEDAVDFTGAHGINMMFNGELDGRAWGGRSCGDVEGSSVCVSTTWNPSTSFTNLAMLAHEMGHGYGLPHSDNSDNDADTYDNPWDLMSAYWSHVGYSGTYGALPKHLNIQQRERLGWVDLPRRLEIAEGANLTGVVLDRASLVASGNVQMVVLPEPGSDATYRLEVRARVAGNSYEANLPGNAVIIHKIYNLGNVGYSVDADVPPADQASNEGSMFKVGETWVSPGNTAVTVTGATANGFLISVSRKRFTGGNLPPRRATAHATATATAQPLRAEQAIELRPRQVESRCVRNRALPCVRRTEPAPSRRP